MSEQFPKPVAQPYGVSHEGAESLVRDWMKHLGIADAEITRYSQDGGIDVASAAYVAQVKNYKGSVSVTEVRELYGVALAEDKSPLLFTSGSVTAEGKSFADRVGMPLLKYGAEDATLDWINLHGREFLSTDMYARAVDNGGQESVGSYSAAAEGADRLAWDAVSPVFKQIPDPASIVISRLVHSGAIAPELRDLIWFAVDTAREADDGIIEYFEEAVRSADSEDIEFAKLHLGIVGIADSHDSQRWAKGIELLSDSMRSNCAEIVARAAWYLASVLRKLGGDAALERVERLEELALSLNDPDALFDSGVRLFGRGERNEARERCLRFLYPELGEPPSPGTRRYGVAQTVLSACQVMSQQEFVRDWYFTAQRAIDIGKVMNGQATIFGDADSYEFRGSFNVELGSASVATRLFPDCPARCFVEPGISSCEHCERSPAVVTTVMAGLGDGVYPVYALLDLSSGDLPVGAVTLFQGSQEGLDDRGDTYALGAALWRAAPLIVGTMRPDGVAFFSDCGKSYDDANLAVDVELASGGGIVVAWVTPPDPEPHGVMNDNVMRPLALGVLTGGLAKQMERALPKLSAQETDELLAAMWNQAGVTVTAHGVDVAEVVSEANISYDFDRDDVRAVSWMIQSAESGGMRAAEVLSTSEDFLASDSLDALERRGNRAISLGWWMPTQKADASVFLLEVLTANDPAATASEVYRLAHHPSVWVRRVVAGREDLPVPAMQSLVVDVDDYVRLQLAQNPSTPVAVLRAMSADVSSAVRTRVAMHKNN